MSEATRSRRGCWRTSAARTRDTRCLTRTSAEPTSATTNCTRPARPAPAAARPSCPARTYGPVPTTSGYTRTPPPAPSCRSVETAQDVLVPVDDPTGDHPGAVREQEHHEVGDLVRLPQLAHGQGRGGPLPPVVARAVEPALGLVLALGVGPADVQAVDPDPVPAVRVRGVAGQPGQPGLGRDVRGQVRLTGVRGGTHDVDDG